MNELGFNEFKIEWMIYDNNGKFINPKIGIIGKSGCGKSFIIRDIMYHLKEIPCGTVIAPTCKMNKFYDSFIGKSYIYYEYLDTIIPSIMDRQIKILAKNENRITNNKKPIDPRCFLIMDDCMSSKDKWMKDPLILSIFNEGRHYQMTYILSMQYCRSLHPEMRSNFDYIFLCAEDIVDNRKRLYQDYAGIFPDLKLFLKAFMEITKDYGIMVINNRIKNSNDLKDRVFWYRAVNRENEIFKVGSKKYIDYNEQVYDCNYDKRSFFDISTYDKKTNINIKLLR